MAYNRLCEPATDGRDSESHTGVDRSKLQHDIVAASKAEILGAM